MKKKIIILLLLMIIVLEAVIVLMITGIIFKNNAIDSCKDCAYARYYKEKELGDELTDYYTDYTSIKNIYSKKVFLGHKLDSDNKIETGYVCGITNNKAFCLEGSEDAYELNKKELDRVFEKDNCTEKTFSESTYYTCSNDEIYSTIYSYGSATISVSKSNMCTYSSNGVMSCYDSCVMNGTCK